VLRIHTDRCLQSRVHNLRRGTIRRRQSQSWSAHDNIEETVTATVRIGEHGPSKCRPAVAVDCSEETAVAIGVGIEIW
jgi:hypothetical protein